ncbi:hypothetical protein [Pleionea sediminis]|uniref:hypothetical protein n=1 Tax=Pleionea sediminis TaxID=2569479 RepID=UPI001184F419|nr:hypothetical protein [Pleionea sediminis]
MSIERIQVGQELLNVPMGQMISSMALAIADAQWELDKSSMVVSELMSGSRPLRDLNTGALLNKNGLAPTSDTDIGVLDSRIYFGYEYDKTTNKRIPKKVSMMELGFVPNFYQFVDTIIEVKIAIKSQSTENQSVDRTYDSNYSVENNNRHFGWSGWSFNRWGGGYNRGHSKTTHTTASHVDASYSQKYGYSVEGASLLRTKMVPVPVPSILEERIRDLMEKEKEFYENENTLES